LQEVFDFLRDKGSGHCANMLTMRRRMGNVASHIGLRPLTEKASRSAREIGGKPQDIAFGAQDTRALWGAARI
jgi:hypothetical protein